MNPPSKDIADILNAVSSLGATAYINNMPNDPDTCISVIDGPGSTPEAKYEYDRPTVQVKVRAKSYNNAYSIISGVKTEIHGKYNINQGGARYIQILAQGGIMSLGYDQNERAIVVLNFSIHRTTQ